MFALIAASLKSFCYPMADVNKMQIDFAVVHFRSSDSEK